MGVGDTEDLSGPGVLVNITSDAPVVVAFGGLMEGTGVPKFEFFRFLTELDVNYVLLRDHEQVWYQLGVRDVADTAAGVADHLADILGVDGLARSIFTGGSMGGYAALLLGSRLDVGAVHAFSPQSFLSRRLRRYYKDFRWPENVARVQAVRGAVLDLKRPLRRTRAPLHVHVGTDPRDQPHINRITGFDGVTVHRHDDARHNVARALHDAGQLRALFEQAIERVG